MHFITKKKEKIKSLFGGYSFINTQIQKFIFLLVEIERY